MHSVDVPDPPTIIRIHQGRDRAQAELFAAQEAPQFTAHGYVVTSSHWSSHDPKERFRRGVIALAFGAGFALLPVLYWIENAGDLDEQPSLILPIALMVCFLGIPCAVASVIGFVLLWQRSVRARTVT